jgi:hypothetical protein
LRLGQGLGGCLLLRLLPVLHISAAAKHGLLLLLLLDICLDCSACCRMLMM